MQRSEPTRMERHPAEHVDVLIVGAGLSGIGAAVHLHQKCPGKTLRRSSKGARRWAAPGISSAIRASAPTATCTRSATASNRGARRRRSPTAPRSSSYVKETAAEYGVDAHIRYQHLATKASWSSDDATWTVEALRRDTGETVRFTCNFLFMCAGYYSYRHGYTPEFAGIERFQRHDRPSAAVAGGPRLRGQEGRRHRLRRDGDDAGAGDGEGRRPHRHAAALADLRRVASRQGRHRQRAAQGAARALGLRHHALEERRAAAVPLSPHAHASGAR